MLTAFSLDQTTRIHGPIPTKLETSFVWHELNRPQVHGYDVLGVSFIGPLKFASIADEKVVRVFESTRNFVSLVKTIGVADIAVQPVRYSILVAVVPHGFLIGTNASWRKRPSPWVI